MVQDRQFDQTTITEACSCAVEAVQRLNGWSERWHHEAAPASGPDLLAELHAANFELWHLEDQARDPLATDAQIAASKRAIDRVNQRRNDTAEAIDEALLRSLAGPADEATPLHSETPGQMLDRLSILSLKLFHTEEEIRRPDASRSHQDRNRDRFDVLQQQQRDLAGCLTELWLLTVRGQRRFKRYHQYKMYNDPELNPVLYRAGLTRAAADIPKA